MPEGKIKEGKYIYCIIQNGNSIDFGPLGIGGRGDKVYTVGFKDISAVVSNSPIEKYSSTRENFISHERAIEEVMKDYTVLPVRFATITEDEEKIKKILEKEYHKFKALLQKMRGKKELGLKAIFKEEVIYKEIVDKYKEIKNLKEALASRSPQATYYQRIKIGKMVEAALEKEKEIYKKDILDTLSPLAVKVKLNDTYGERMIMSSAFLVNEEKEEKFDQKVDEVHAKYGEKIRFKYVGTLPPFNFVNLMIMTGEY